MKPLAIYSALLCGALTPSAYALEAGPFTFYGRLNATVEHQELGQNDDNGIFNNSSRLGITLSQPLTDNLTLGGGLEMGFRNSNEFSDELANLRRRELNLSGSWGMIRYGHFFAESYYATADMVAMHNHDTGSSADALYVYNNRNKHRVALRTPTKNGLWAELAHSLPEKNYASGRSDKDFSTWDLAVNYDKDALGLGFGASRTDNVSQAALRAHYATGPWIIGGYVQHARDETPNTKQDWNVYRAALRYTAGKSEYHLSAGLADHDTNTSAQQYTVGYNYNLSKATKLYGYYTTVINEDQGSYGYGFNGELSEGIPVGEDFESIAIGVRHNF